MEERNKRSSVHSVQCENMNKSILMRRSANEWMRISKHIPMPKMLFSEFWYEGEICFLFADTNTGKSILAVQLGDSISSGIPVSNFKLESKKQKVLYFDFELSSKQFESRYSEKVPSSDVFENHYEFDDYFLRIELSRDIDYSEVPNVDEMLIRAIEETIIETSSRVLIVDNLTYLKDETEKAKDASPLMKKLKELKTKYSLSILILAHTPKRDLSKPITQNDLKGSKNLMNFSDSCFALGQSTKGSDIRYIKQIKARNTSILYDISNVITCRINKSSNFLGFEFIDFNNEIEHLKEKPSKVTLISKVKEMIALGHTFREISKETGLSLGTVSNYANEDEQ